jgi:hypothetical protein
VLARVRQPGDLAPRPVLDANTAPETSPGSNPARVHDPRSVPGRRPCRARLGERRVVDPCRCHLIETAERPALGCRTCCPAKPPRSRSAPPSLTSVRVMNCLWQVGPFGPGVRRRVVDENVGRARSACREPAADPDAAVVRGDGHLGQGDRRVRRVAPRLRRARSKAGGRRGCRTHATGIATNRSSAAAARAPGGAEP